MDIRTVGIVGAGQMGNGIAHVFALSGYEVLLNDISDEGLKRAVATIDKNLERQASRGKITEATRAEAMARIKTTLVLPDLGACDLIIEAATEKEAVKNQIFETLAPHLAPQTILTSNTSSISITRLASRTDRPERFMGFHFMNPVPVMQLVELIRGIATNVETYDTLLAVVGRLGKTAASAMTEVREAIDFLRFYAAQIRQDFDSLSHRPLGPVVCISPWNFPLAIFTGQIVAALVTGNTVVAKPAETTPEVALAMTDLLYRAGVPRDALHVLPMVGKEFGDIALKQPALAGVVFTGSTRTAQWLNRALAARDGAILPLIAETGGINAMIVDSTALPEQVVDDVSSSAFGSAGQRCSALRLLCLQADNADRILEMLEGAMETLVVGDPQDLTTDVGPVITTSAAADLEQHIQRMCQRGRLLKRAAISSNMGLVPKDRFVAPALIEIDSVSALDREAFGPILHVLRYRTDDLPQLLDGLRANGYGLTLGIQTRLDGTRRALFEGTLAGNVYVNRNMIGAVVGVQPFGGTGLSGTGPKAGGPHYLNRFTTERVLTINTTATGGNTALLTLE
jgi:RHH-type proline utilization regulon transcriptional repressor/proline dehydrogenase/delta 1-pyrroline-5-carboxylate dehydrogenase